MLFHIGKSISRKLHKHNKLSIHPLNLEFFLEALCMIYTAELQDFLEDKRERLLTGTEGNTLYTLVINSPNFDCQYLIESLKTNASFCCSECRCFSGPGTDQVLETNDDNMELEEYTET